MKQPRVVPCFAIGLLLWSSCGYHVAGRGDRLPPDIKTIAIPIFANSTRQFKIEQRVTAALTREFIERTKYQVTTDPAAADALIKGDIKHVRSGAIAYDPSTGRATTFQIQITAHVDLIDQHTKKILFTNHNYIFREEYQISQNPSTIFEEQNPALDRIARDLARSLVTEILENF
jgi:hypothetical protein